MSEKAKRVTVFQINKPNGLVIDSVVEIIRPDRFTGFLECHCEVPFDGSKRTIAFNLSEVSHFVVEHNPEALVTQAGK